MGMNYLLSTVFFNKVFGLFGSLENWKTSSKRCVAKSASSQAPLKNVWQAVLEKLTFRYPHKYNCEK